MWESVLQAIQQREINKRWIDPDIPLKKLFWIDWIEDRIDNMKGIWVLHYKPGKLKHKLIILNILKSLMMVVELIK